MTDDDYDPTAQGPRPIGQADEVYLCGADCEQSRRLIRQKAAAGWFSRRSLNSTRRIKLINFRIAALGMFAALGLATTAVAQQSSGSMPEMTAEQHRQMMSRGDQKGQGGMMMNQADMTQMMGHCQKMMKMMDDKSDAPISKR